MLLNISRYFVTQIYMLHSEILGTFQLFTLKAKKMPLFSLKTYFTSIILCYNANVCTT